jgi:hypothetical protein
MECVRFNPNLKVATLARYQEGFFTVCEVPRASPLTTQIYKKCVYVHYLALFVYERPLPYFMIRAATKNNPVPGRYQVCSW